MGLISRVSSRTYRFTMGILKSKPKKEAPRPEKSRISEQDRAVLELKKQRDSLRRYQRKIDKEQERLKGNAVALMKSGRKDRALLLLKKKKAQDKLWENANGALENIERMTEEIEWAQVQVDVVKQLDQGKALKSLHKICSLEEVERVMDETQEGMDYTNQISEALGAIGAESMFTDDELSAELDEMFGTASDLNEIPE